MIRFKFERLIVVFHGPLSAHLVFSSLLPDVLVQSGICSISKTHSRLSDSSVNETDFKLIAILSSAHRKETPQSKKQGRMFKGP